MKIKKINKTLYNAGIFLNKKLLKKLNLQINDNVTHKLDKAHIVLANHSSVMDYRITTFAMRKHKAYHVAAKNQFAGKKWLMQRVGCLPKVQFVPSLALIKQIKQVLINGDHVVVFPEGVVSFDGTNRLIPTSISKMIKYLGVPVAVLNIKGTYLAKPRYNQKAFNKVDKIEADFDVVLSQNDVKNMSIEQIHKTITDALHFDVWKWNKDNDVKTVGDLTTGLNNILFECVNCHGKTAVNKNNLVCYCCGKSWAVDEYFRLYDGEKELTISQWFAKLRQYINNQLQNERFAICKKVKVQRLDGFAGYKYVGEGVYHQGLNGVTFDGTIDDKSVNLTFEAEKHWAVPADNNFVEFSQNNQTYRFLFEEEGIAIKCALAVEESFKILQSTQEQNF